VGGLVVEPPAAGPDVCRLCRGRCRPHYSVCFPCVTAMSQVRWPLRRVVPVSLYRPGDELHHVLRHYKDSPDPVVRAELADLVGALLASFLFARAAVVAPGGWDGLVVVPSTRGRPGPHPLAAALGGISGLSAQLVEALAPAGPSGHGQASDELFRATADVAGRALVVVDDTMTAGARLHSAASALTGAGATVEVAVAVGRAVNPAASPAVAGWWERHARRPSPPLRPAA